MLMDNVDKVSGNQKTRKICKKCHESLPLNMFYKKGNYYQSYCIPCRKELNSSEEHKEKRRQYYQKTKEKRLLASKKWRDKNLDNLKIKYRDYYYSNREKCINKSSSWNKKNKTRINLRNKEYWKKNPDKLKFNNAQRKRKIRERTPNWLTKEHLSQIKDFYDLSMDLYSITGEKYHVDHIVPLKGENVCGLHVPWNLQVLPSDINLKKGNTYDTNI